jgi:hypothetical protein
MQPNAAPDTPCILRECFPTNDHISMDRDMWVANDVGHDVCPVHCFRQAYACLGKSSTLVTTRCFRDNAAAARTTTQFPGHV